MFILSQYVQISYRVLNYLKIHNKFYEDMLISEGLSSKEMIAFSDIDKDQDVDESIHKKIFQMKQNIYGSIEDILSMHRTRSNETALVSEIPCIINNENFIIAPGQEKKLVLILIDQKF